MTVQSQSKQGRLPDLRFVYRDWGGTRMSDHTLEQRVAVVRNAIIGRGLFDRRLTDDECLALLAVSDGSPAKAAANADEWHICHPSMYVRLEGRA